MGFVAALLTLAGCSALPGRARHDLVGMTLPDFLACAGQPTERMRIAPRQWALTFPTNNWSTPSLSGAVPLLGDLVKPTVSASASESCRMTARIRDGRVASIHFVATSSLTTSASAACAPLVRDCLLYPDHTMLPADYDADAYLQKGSS
ncbi:hypothetical protein HK28_00520 [Acetobacter sp. DsW_063]|nr:hypothetical protein HK28_00520 [Acetobacter sp. DsW_063]